MTEITIHIPSLPDSKLGPNKSRKQHWGTTAKVKGELMHNTLGACLEALKGKKWKLLVEADCRIKIVNAKRAMDMDNLLGCLKHSFDVLQGRIIENDDKLWIHPPIEWVKGPVKDTGIWMTISERVLMEKGR